MLILKAGVRLHDWRPQLTLAVIAAQPFWEAAGVDFVITSANDSQHSVASLHYCGAAFDVRTKNLDTSDRNKEALALQITGMLGPDFDVLFEGGGTGSEHMHLEYQPKA